MTWGYQSETSNAIVFAVDPVSFLTLAQVIEEILTPVLLLAPELGVEAELYVVESPKAYPAEEIGVFDRLAGVFQVDILSRLHTGIGSSSRLADALVLCVEGRLIQGIRFSTPEIGDGDEFKGKWRIQVTCPWSVEVPSKARR